MKVYAVAMTEVQEDSVLCNSDAAGDWESAVEIAYDFMTRCVGDFLEIDPGDWAARRAAVEENVCREPSVFKGNRRLECHYECEALVVTTCVQETDL